MRWRPLRWPLFPTSPHDEAGECVKKGPRTGLRLGTRAGRLSGCGSKALAGSAPDVRGAVPPLVPPSGQLRGSGTEAAAKRCDYSHIVRIRAGTSGWSYAAWKGRFYPADLPAHRMLPAYAARLDTVEVNATFYRMPRPATLADWREQVPEGFRFALKAPQRITHAARLAGAEDALGVFQRAAAELGPKLGPVLFQLPPTMKQDLPRLRDFLALLPRGGRAAFEFREPSWFDEAVLSALAAAGAALCVADTEEGETPLIPTAGFGYLRLRRPDYDLPALARWASRVSSQPWAEAFVFFKHEDEARGPELAQAFNALWTAGGAEVHP